MSPKIRMSVDLSEEAMKIIAHVAVDKPAKRKKFVEQHLEEWAKELEKKKQTI